MSIQAMQKENNINLSSIKIQYIVLIIEKIFLTPNVNFDIQLLYMKCYEICQERLYKELSVSIIKSVYSLSQNLLLKALTSDESIIEDVINLHELYSSNAFKLSDGLVYVENKVKNLYTQSFSFTILFEQIFFYNILTPILDEKIITLYIKKLKQSREDELNIECLKKFIDLLTKFKEIHIETNIVDKESNCLTLEEIIFSMTDENLKKGRMNCINDDFKNLKERFLSFFNKLFDLISIETTNHYSEYNAKFCDNNRLNYHSYIDMCNSILNREKILFSSLDKDYQLNVISIIFNQLILSDIEYLFTYIYDNIDNNENLNTISTVYKMFKCYSIDLFYKEFNSIIEKYILNLKNSIINFYDELTEKSTRKKSITDQNLTIHSLIIKILEHKNKIINFTTKLFNNETKDDRINQIVKSLFEKVVNIHNGFFIKKFIFYIHEEIKYSVKNNKFSNIHELKEPFLVIYKLIQEKDIFEKDYRDKLSKRLLRNSSLIKETEFSFLDIIRIESGKHFVKKIEVMIQDIWLSRQLSIEFSSRRIFSNPNSRMPSRHVSKHQNTQINQSTTNMPIITFDHNEKKIDFSIKILDNESWPVTNNNMKFHIPSELTTLSNQFNEFYVNKYKGRNLTYLNHLSWTEINANINNKKYILICSGIQMAILMLFNKTKQYSLPKIIELLEVSSQSLKEKDIESVVLQELENFIEENILLINNNNYTLNCSFQSNNYKIVLNKQKSKLNDNSDINKDKEICPMVLEDRKYKIDASIMKIIKNKKIVDFSSLHIDVSSYLKHFFIPDLSMMKARIENLIDRSLIIRDIENTELFKYSS